MFGNVLPSAARATDLVCPSWKQLTVCMCMSIYGSMKLGVLHVSYLLSYD